MSDGPRTAHPCSAAITPRQAGWLLGLLSLTVVLLELGGDSLRLSCRYDRVPVLQGEYWRLLTGHLVHASWEHLIGNLAGVGLVAALFPRDYSLKQWLLILSLSAVSIDAGFVLHEPQLQWYVGLSGILHGALAAGAIAWWRHEARTLALILTGIFIGKLGWEQAHGALPFSGDLTVVVDAHLYGAMGGLVAAVLIGLWQHYWPRRARSL
jgi:rhomboid family GlyGly-CTERM serine protease